MKPKQTYLKGKSIFIVSLLVIGVTILTVYISGADYQRSITENLYWSLGIIGLCLFLFMIYGLYKNLGLVDDFPKYKDFKSKDSLTSGSSISGLPEVEMSGGIGGIIVSILLWVVMSVVLLFLLIVLEAVFWFSLFIILTMLYWVFFRALKLVFSKSAATKGDWALSIAYAAGYTLLYTGWMFGIVYLVEIAS